METITFHCKVITPMFLAGADGQTPELRAPSIKGAMRFWWRAMNGHLPLEEMRKKEEAIFGGTDTGGRSSIIIRVSQSSDLVVSSSLLVPHKSFMKQNAIQEGQEFKVVLGWNKSRKKLSEKELAALFKITCILGGFGKRVRRGMGSVIVVKTENCENVPDKITLPYIHDLLGHFSKFYELTEQAIQFNYPGRSEKYGYIKQIQIGEAGKHSNILRVISNATHRIKQKAGYAYDPSMGHAFKGRYASPVFVSVVGNDMKPVITTLNIAPDKNEHKASLMIQEDFKRLIL
jgi:CRISPR-associated protein Cmr1